MSSNIKKFQLTSGRDVIGKVVDETATTITLEYPLVIQVVPNGPKEYGLALPPYDPINPEGKSMFFKAQIVSELLDIPDGMEKAYLQQTSSIQIVSALDQMEGMC